MQVKNHHAYNFIAGAGKYEFNATLTDRDYLSLPYNKRIMLLYICIMVGSCLTSIVVNQGKTMWIISLVTLPILMFGIALNEVENKQRTFGQDASLEISSDGIYIELYFLEADGIPAATEHYSFLWENTSVSLNRSGHFHIEGSPAVAIDKVPIVMERNGGNFSRSYHERYCSLTFMVLEPRSNIRVLCKFLKEAVRSQIRER